MRLTSDWGKYHKNDLTYTPDTLGIQTKKKGLRLLSSPEKKPGNVLLSQSQSSSTIAAEALHFRVRYGNGCFLLAMITGKIR